MHSADLLDLCLSLPYAVEETPFGPDVVAVKVGGKIFAFVPLDTMRPQVSVKAQPESVIEIQEMYLDATPAPHLNKKHWVRLYADGKIPGALIEECISTSYQLVWSSLTKAIRAQLEASKAAK